MKRIKFMRRFFRKGNPRKLVNQFDSFVKADIIDATNRGKTLLGIDEDKIFAHPSLVYSMPYVANKKMHASLVHLKDRVRFDLSHFNALYFDDETLYYYNTVIDHRIKGSFNDAALEIPYKNIIAIETSLKFITLNRAPHYVFELKLKLLNLGDLTIPLRVMVIDQKTPENDFLIDKDLMDIVTKLKQFLRTKMI